MKRKNLIASSLTVLALSLGTAWAGSPATSAGGGDTGSSVTGGGAAPAAQRDRKFIEEAAGSGMFEVQVAQLAVTKASDTAVKDFASKLVDHHSAANNELVKLANAKGVELPPAPPRNKRRDIEKLGKLSGAEFDREFVREVGIKDHEKDIKDFEKASKDVKDPELKAWVDKTLPTLKQHLASAQQLPGAKEDASRMGNRGTTAPATGLPGEKKMGS